MLTKRRLERSVEAGEPTVLAITLRLTGAIGLLGICTIAILGMPAFGYTGWTFAGVAAMIAAAVSLPWHKSLPGHKPLSRGRRRYERFNRRVRQSFIVLLVIWLGLLAWLAFCPGGSNPPAKAEADFIRVVTWNIHIGQDKGPPWKQFDWRRRKHALQEALEQAQPDILCVQEESRKQVEFLEKTLQAFGRIGVGSNGGSSGEHCSIYFNRDRFTEMDGGTFWLTESANEPKPRSALDFNRICTWVRLRDQVSGRTFRVYNTHFPLTEEARQTAARIIVKQIAEGDPTDAIVLTGDFNASPSASSRRLLLEAGLDETASRAGKPVGEPTFQLYGIGLWNLDGILVNAKWDVLNHRIVDIKPRNVFPSDHFAVLADLAMVE